MFGLEAAKLLDYVECFPDGYRKGTKMAKACTDAKIEGFPMWVINGQVRKPCFSPLLINSYGLNKRIDINNEESSINSL